MSLIWRDCLATNPRTGGGLRSRQIAEIVDRMDVAWLDLCHWRDKRPLRDSLSSLSAVWRFPGAGRMPGRMRRRVAYKYDQLENLAETTGWPQCLVWENTRDHTLLLFGRRHGIPVVALPHNIESIGSPEQLRYNQRGIHERFKCELDLLRRAHKVLTISTTDRWLLSLFDVSADVLPYLPPLDRRTELNAVRRLRESESESKRDLVLVMGTAEYEPNRYGMDTLLSYLDSAALPREARIVVVGYGTEMFANRFSENNIEIEGTVSDERLLTLYEQAAVGLIYQQPSSGVLTRVPDLLLAGVPVVANTHAARGWHGLEGLEVFRELGELPGRLECLLAKREVVHPAMRDDSERLLEVLRDSLGSA